MTEIECCYDREKNLGYAVTWWMKLMISSQSRRKNHYDVTSTTSNTDRRCTRRLNFQNHGFSDDQPNWLVNEIIREDIKFVYAWWIFCRAFLMHFRTLRTTAPEHPLNPGENGTQRPKSMEISRRRGTSLLRTFTSSDYSLNLILVDAI